MRLGGLAALLATLAALLATVFAVIPAASASVAPGFTDKVVLSGATQPTAVRFVNGGSYVAEKDGRILFYKSFGSQPSLVADLSTEVYDAGDHGLLGLAIDPRYPSRPYLYVLYSYDAAIGGTAPRWGVPGVLQDICPTPPGANIDGCVTSGRLSRLTVKRHSVTSEAVLINDWCNQFTTHSIGDLRFGQDGNLYASGGDGAKVGPFDYGQFGSPVNPCGDPPGGAMSPPGAEGGSLRSQDLQTPNDPVNLDGTLIRINPSTGQGAATNPLASSGDPNARRIVAYGMRNPFRFTIRPGTNDVWIGDVGLSTWEEIDRLPNSTTQPVTNFGWPCHEGAGQQPQWASLGLDVCSNLYTAGTATGPYFAYNHAASVVAGDGCPTAHSSISGIAFGGSSFTAPYTRALFFSDFARNCIWAMLPGANGLPDPARVVSIVSGAAGPVDLERGPGDDLYYVNIADGTVHRLHG